VTVVTEEKRGEKRREREREERVKQKITIFIAFRIRI